MEKVLHIVNTGNYSGLENVVMNICLLDNTHKHVYVAPSGIIDEILNDNYVEKITIRQINPTTIRKLLKKEKATYVHAHDFNAMFCLALNFDLILKKNIKIVAHIHNNNPEMKKISLRSILFLISSLVYKKIIIVSKAVEEEYIFKYIVRKKFYVLNNIINDELIMRLSKDALKGNVRYDLCFIGRLTEPKDPLRFIHLVHEVNRKGKINAVMIGDGDLREECLEEISRLNLKDTINLIGFDANPYKFLAKSKMLVLTSKWEGFGLVALESLYLGKPAVVSRVGGLPKIIDDSVGALCETDEEFTRAILKFLSCKENKDELKEKRIEKFHNLNNKSEFVKSLLYTYKTL